MASKCPQAPTSRTRRWVVVGVMGLVVLDSPPALAYICEIRDAEHTMGENGSRCGGIQLGLGYGEANMA
jgi:hypothetical protein